MARKYDYSKENQFNKRYSRFKLHAYLQKRAPLTHYGQERYGSTYMQLLHGHVKKITLDRERGLDDCIERLQIWDKLYTVTTALIYDRRRSTLVNGEEILGKEIQKYKGLQLIEWEELALEENEKKVPCEVTVINQVIRIKPIIIQPVQTTIDFKTEIENALSKKDTTTTGANH